MFKLLLHNLNGITFKVSLLCSTVLEQSHVFGNYEAGNDSWNGIMEMLRTGKVDVAVSEITLSKDRRDIIDYSVPIFYTR